MVPGAVWISLLLVLEEEAWDGRKGVSASGQAPPIWICSAEGDAGCRPDGIGAPAWAAPPDAPWPIPPGEGGVPTSGERGPPRR